MSYAVIQLTGKQYKVSEGEKLTVGRLTAKEGETITVTDVLLTSKGENTVVGTPLVAGASVTLKVMLHDRAPKIRVAKFKAKSRYRKVQGHKQPQTQVEVVAIKN